LVKIFNGVASAALNFVGVGLVAPYVLNYLSPRISSYITLPPPSQIWDAFILFGAVFAVTGFLQSGYSKGEYPWLFGKVGGGLLGLAFFYYLFLLLPSSVGSEGVEGGGLILLVGLAIALSYGYLAFDFLDARRKIKANKVAMDSKATTATPVPSGS
jgi:hypothetical protein